MSTQGDTPDSNLPPLPYGNAASPAANPTGTPATPQTAPPTGDKADTNLPPLPYSGAPIVMGAGGAGDPTPIVVTARSRYVPPADYNPTLGGVLGGALMSFLPHPQNGWHDWTAGGIINGATGLLNAAYHATPLPGTVAGTAAGIGQIIAGHPENAGNAALTAQNNAGNYSTEKGLLTLGGGVLQHVANAAAEDFGTTAPQFASTGPLDTMIHSTVNRWQHPIWNLQNNAPEMVGDLANLAPGVDIAKWGMAGVDAARAASLAAKAGEVADAGSAADAASAAAKAAPPSTGALSNPPTSIADIRARLRANQSPAPETAPPVAPTPGGTPPPVGRPNGMTHDADVMRQALSENGNQLNNTTLQRMDELQAAKDAASRPAAAPTTPDIPPAVPFTGPKPITSAFGSGIRQGIDNDAFNAAKAGKPMDPIAEATKASVGSTDAPSIAPAMIQSAYDAVKKSNFAGASNVTGVSSKVTTAVDGIMNDIGTNAALQTPQRLAQISDRLGAMKAAVNPKNVADINYLSDSQRLIDDTLQSQAPTFQNMRSRIQAANQIGGKANSFTPNVKTALADAVIGAGGDELLGGALGAFGKKGAQAAGHAAFGPLGGATAGLIASSPRLSATTMNLLGAGLRPVVQGAQMTGALVNAARNPYVIAGAHDLNEADYANTNPQYTAPLSNEDYLKKNPRYPISQPGSVRP